MQPIQLHELLGLPTTTKKTINDIEEKKFKEYEYHTPELNGTRLLNIEIDSTFNNAPEIKYSAVTPQYIWSPCSVSILRALLCATPYDSYAQNSLLITHDHVQFYLIHIGDREPVLVSIDTSVGCRIDVMAVSENIYLAEDLDMYEILFRALYQMVMHSTKLTTSTKSVICSHVTTVIDILNKIPNHSDTPLWFANNIDDLLLILSLHSQDEIYLVDQTIEDACNEYT